MWKQYQRSLPQYDNIWAGFEVRRVERERAERKRKKAQQLLAREGQTMKRELIDLADEDERAQLLAPQWAKEHMLDKLAHARNKLNRSASVLGAMGMSFAPPPGMGMDKVPETKEEEPEGPKRIEFVLGRSQRDRRLHTGQFLCMDATPQPDYNACRYG